MARPSRYTTKLGDAICDRIAEGDSLLTVLEAEGTPSYRTVMNWLAWGAEDKQPYATFLQNYTRARADQADYIFDKISGVAADTEIDVQRARLIVDTEKWRLGRMKPKKYGTDRQEVEHSGPDGGAIPFTWAEPAGDE